MTKTKKWLCAGLCAVFAFAAVGCSSDGPTIATVNGEIVTWRSLLVKILAQVVILVLNYIFSKLVIFKKKETAEKETAE